MQSSKLSAKDLINVGIYTAMYLVIFFVIGMINAIPVLYPFLYVIVPIATGIPFMLFLTKADKFGMVFIMSVILGLFWYLMGYTYLPIIGYCVMGALADLVLKAGKYKSFKASVLGYWLFSCAMISCQAPMWLLLQRIWKRCAVQWGINMLKGCKSLCRRGWDLRQSVFCLSLHCSERCLEGGC